MSYTFPTVVINNVTYTAKRWGQFPTISYTAGATAGQEVVTVASDLSNINVQIADGVSTNTQINNAIANAKGAAVESLYASDLVSVAITSGHESDAASATSAQAMTGAAQTPPPSPTGRVLPSVAIPSTTIDWSLARLYSKTLSANTTFTFVNAADGLELEVAITNTASNYTVTWPSGIKWSGGSAPTQTVGAKTDVYRFRQIGTVIYGTAAQNLS